MSTGLSSLSKLSEVSTLYPFAGIEYLLVAVLFAYLIIFFVWQSAMEHKHIKSIMGAHETADTAPPESAMAAAE